MKALDLFCKAGGASKGLHDAGYDVLGVDIVRQPHYPYSFVWGDAMEYPLDGFDLIWASPPCQLYSVSTPAHTRNNHPDLLPVILDKLRKQSTPYIVENVLGSQWMMHNPRMLCGTMFGKQFFKHRYFEIGNVDILCLTSACNHNIQPALPCSTNSIYRKPEDSFYESIAFCKQAFDVPWMNMVELRNAVPPIYSKYLASLILQATHIP